MEYLRRIMNSLAWRVESLEAHASDANGSRKRIWDDLCDEEASPLRKRFSNADRRSNAEVEMASPLFRATEAGDAEAILRLLEDNTYYIPKMNRRGESALHVAARLGHDRAVIALLRHIYVDLLDDNKRTALHWACTRGHERVVRHLLSAGANVNVRDCEGEFPLLFAARIGHLQIAKLLIDRNVELDRVDNGGNSALVAAAEAKQWEMVEFLLRRGASASVYNKGDYSPLYLVVKADKYRLLSDVLKLLNNKEHEMKVTLMKCRDLKVAQLFEIAVPGFCKSAEARDIMPAFAYNGAIDLLRFMLDSGASVDGVDSHTGLSCLMSAAWGGRAAVVRMLLARGADVNLRQRTHRVTALHFAADGRDVECVRLLVAAGAQVDAKDSEWKRPVDYADSTGIIHLLTSRPPRCSSA